MRHQAKRNRLRSHRKRSGLSAREIGALIGYKNYWQVSRHERLVSAPPLLAALAYEVLFQVPVSAIFVGMHAMAATLVEQNLAAFERILTDRGTGQSARLNTQKLKWLKERSK
jgi:hypothetical protein